MPCADGFLDGHQRNVVPGLITHTARDPSMQGEAAKMTVRSGHVDYIERGHPYLQSA